MGIEIRWEIQETAVLKQANIEALQSCTNTFPVRTATILVVMFTGRNTKIISPNANRVEL